MNQLEEKENTENGQLESLLEAGLHMGHSHSRSHPQMKPFIFGTRNNIDIIDVTKTKEKLREAEAFLSSVAEQGGMILFVGTRPGIASFVKEVAHDLHMPAVTTRWIGGTLTNFSVISKRVKDMEELERLQNTGEIEKYPKKERMQKELEMKKLQRLFDGIRSMKSLPQAMIIFNLLQDETAVREAKIKNIKTVGIVDTNADPEAVTYAIPANDDAVASIRFLLERLKTAIQDGMEKRATKETAKAESKE